MKICGFKGCDSCGRDNIRDDHMQIELRMLLNFPIDLKTLARSLFGAHFFFIRTFQQSPDDCLP